MPLSRPSEKVAPPQKVIKALISHRSTNPQELSYTKGDFWYVTGEKDVWYEALNPLTNSRGLVPKGDFEEFSKGGRQTSGGRPPSSSQDSSRSHTPSQGHVSQSSNPRSPPMPIMSPTEGSRKVYQPLYAIVQYDFQAERPDELDAKAGEPIVIIAQSNHEWFVAKPIGRLGGPGLIPVAFVQIRDTVTGKPVEKLPDSIPLVEEWKKATADYKAASIPLGRFDFPADQAVSNSPYAPSRNSQSQSQSSTSLPRSGSQQSIQKAMVGNGSVKSPIYRPEQDPYLPPGELTALSVVSFHNESGNYWFRLQVAFSPDDPSAPNYALTLYRTYEDFYDFQISLLDTFPYEAGRPPADEPDGTPPERILPYMPGPVEEGIDDELTEYRREELDTYVKALVELGERGRGDILGHELFRGFFAAKYGDYCEDVPRAGQRLSRPTARSSRAGGPGMKTGNGGEGVEELDERMGGVRLDNGEYTRSASQQGHLPSSQQSRSASSQGHVRGQSHSRSNSGYERQTPSAASGSYNPSGAINNSGGPSRSGSSRNPSPLPPIESGRPGSGGYTQSAHVRNPSQSQSQSQTPYSTQPYSAGPSTGASSSSFSHHASHPSQSGLPAPAGAGGGSGQPPYIKIKVYDRSTDDLIALRVHPNVSHAELFEKVTARLGGEVRCLRYRVGMGSGVQQGAGGGYRDIRNDTELRDWMRGEDQKLVLYAEQ